jgi:amino acid transporter
VDHGLVQHVRLFNRDPWRRLLFDHILSMLIFACAFLILSAIGIADPTYKVDQWQIFALTVLLLLAHASVASLPTLFLVKVTEMGAIVNGLSLLAFFIVIPAASINTPKFASTPEVWGTFENGTDWPIGFAVLMSFLSVIWTLAGYDAPFHLTEECSNAAISAPRAIVITSGMGAILGWFLVLLISYTIVDIDEILDSALSQPMASYLLQVLGKRGGLGLLSVVIICLYFTGQTCLIVSSRLLFAYARDGALPGSSIWSKVSQRTKTPVFSGNI